MIARLLLVVAVGCGSPSKLDGDPDPQQAITLNNALDLGWIEADDTHVYFTTSDEAGIAGKRQIGRIPTGGGAPQLYAEVPGPSRITLFALDDERIYVVLDDLRHNFRIASIPKSGGALAVLADFAAVDVDGLAVLGDTLYLGVWTDERAHEIRAIETRGGEARQIALTINIADEATLHRGGSDETRRSSRIAVDRRRVYWLRHDSHDVALDAFDLATGERVSSRKWRGSEPYGLYLAGNYGFAQFDDSLSEQPIRADEPDQVRLLLDGLGNARVAMDGELLVVAATVTPMPRHVQFVVTVFELATQRQVTIADSARSRFRPIEVAISDNAIYVVDSASPGTARDTLLQFPRPRFEPAVP